MHFHCLQHVFFETPGYIETWIQDNRHTLSTTRLFEQDTLPAPDDFDALLILGGYMSVHDEKDHPWLIPEKHLISETIRNGKKIIGICLGSQLIADVLGASVFPNPFKEIGFMPVHLTNEAKKLTLFHEFNEEWVAFHWHGETFTLPDGAIHLAFTKCCTNQAYLVGHTILGLQFHPEATAQIVREMVEHDKSELIPAPYIDSQEKILSNLDILESNKEMLYSLLDQFITL